MRKYLLGFTVSVMIGALGASAQNLKRCGSMEYLEKQLAEDPGRKARMEAIEEDIQNVEQAQNGMRSSDVVITIPVVFHILYSNNPQNISNSRIYDQLNQLNKDYARMNADSGNTPAVFAGVAANTNIQFCLAQQDTAGNFTTGIIRKQVGVSGFDPLSNDNVKYSALGGDDIWDRNQYLNIWVCNFTGASQLIIGISQFPGGAASTDGVVVLYGTVGGENFPGTTQFYNRGRTLTHEVGHWLNLWHIWGQNNTCNGDDFVTDTPNQADANYGCPNFPTISCNNGPNGDMFMNYMDYGDDICLNMFTAGQGTRMTNVLNTIRSGIKNSTKCVDLTSIAKPADQIAFNVYPNPSSGEIAVVGNLPFQGDAAIRVFNLLGEVVYTRDVRDASSMVENIDLSALPNGTYSVEVRMTGACTTKKVILARE